MRELTVLYVDADDSERTATRDALVADDAISVVDATSVATASDAIDRERVDCVVTEYDLPDGTGLDVAARLRETAPDTPCILFTNASPNLIDTGQYEDVVVEYLPRDMPDTRESLVRLVGNVVTERSQVGYPLPTKEDERLAALEQYDRPGTAVADAFDRLTTLARSYFGVDVAFAGLVDAHEERFLACAGADWETLTREDSACTHTLLEDDMLVVDDTHTDERFEDNDRLDELDIRAYAGVPLETPRGATVGAFCLTYDEPRAFSDEDLADLRLFAAEAMDQLELRRRLNERSNDPETEATDGGTTR